MDPNEETIDPEVFADVGCRPEDLPRRNWRADFGRERIRMLRIPFVIGW